MWVDLRTPGSASSTDGGELGLDGGWERSLREEGEAT